MTFIFSFLAITGAIVCLWIGLRFWRSFLRSKIETLKNYSYCFIFNSFACIFLVLPGLNLFNPFFIQIDIILVDISFLLAILFIVPATLFLFELTPRFKRITFLIIFWWTLIYIFLNIFFFAPAIPFKSGDLVYYWRSGTPWLQLINRILIALSICIVCILYFRGTKLFPEKTFSIKSFLIGLGGSLVLTAGFLFWFVSFFYFSPALLIFSGLIGFTGFSLVAIAALMFPPLQRRFVKKIT